jgi:hypothetical protein
LIHVVARPCPWGDSLADQPEERKPMLEISPAKVVQVIFQSREGDRADEELEAFIDAMNEDEKTSLVALAWVGRGAFDAAEFDEARAIAAAEATTPTARYLMGMPHLAENLEAGLDAMGIDVTEAEEDFL